MVYIIAENDGRARDGDVRDEREGDRVLVPGMVRVGEVR